MKNHNYSWFIKGALLATDQFVASKRCGNSNF